MKAHLLVKVWAASMLAFTFAVILWACQKEKYPDDTIDTQIAKSAEMENYIVAGYELQIALNEWQKAMDAIDWSNLSFVTDEEGREVAHLPVSNLVLEAKLEQFNNCKSALQRKYPQVKVLSLEKSYDIVWTCVQRSEVVAMRLLDLGININQPQTRPYLLEGDIYDGSFGFLSTWAKDTNNVEAIRLGFANGHSLTYVNGGNTVDSCFLPHRVRDGNAYFPDYPSSPIRSIIHTHNDNMIHKPSDADYTGKIDSVNNIEYGIFWRDSVYKY